MGFLNELEENLEKYIEKLFSGKGKGRLQSMDIARQLAREMRRNRRVGLKEVYVPNHYEIYLGEEDFAVLEPVVEHLASEMKEYITGKAEEKKYTLTGPVNVEFNPEEENSAGEEQIRIASYYDEQVPARNDEQQNPQIEDTLRFVPVRETVGHQLEQHCSRMAVLETAGGEQYVIDEDDTLLGRRETCNIFLPDTSISRKHAAITRQGNQYVISDLGSTNGTYVNGTRVAERELEPGDVIKIGNTVLTFKVV